MTPAGHAKLLSRQLRRSTLSSTTITPINGVTYRYSLNFVNETTGAYGGTYTATESNGHVNGPSPWSDQAVPCSLARPVEIELPPPNAGNGNSCQRPPEPDGFKTPNPIIPATGEKVLDHEDYAGQGPAALSLTRNYRSGRVVGIPTATEAGWRR